MHGKFNLLIGSVSLKTGIYPSSYITHKFDRERTDRRLLEEKFKKPAQTF